MTQSSYICKHVLYRRWTSTLLFILSLDMNTLQQCVGLYENHWIKAQKHHILELFLLSLSCFWYLTTQLTVQPLCRHDYLNWVVCISWGSRSSVLPLKWGRCGVIGGSDSWVALWYYIVQPYLTYLLPLFSPSIRWSSVVAVAWPGSFCSGVVDLVWRCRWARSTPGMGVMALTVFVELIIVYEICLGFMFNLHFCLFITLSYLVHRSCVCVCSYSSCKQWGLF